MKGPELPLFVIALGALMLLGGIAALVLGLPYIVLERGFTQVIIGSVVATGGVLVMVGGLTLRELRRGQALPDDAAALAPDGMAAGAAGSALAGQTDRAAEEEPAEELQPMLPFMDGPAPETAMPEARGSDQPSEPESLHPAEGKAAEPAIHAAGTAGGRPAPGDEHHDEHVDGGPAPACANDTYDDLRASLRAELELSNPVPEPETKPDAGDDAAEGAKEPAIAPDPQAAPGWNDAEQAEPAPETDESADDPVSSVEGIVSVRQVGDSTYTMYADGTVRADSPSGTRLFGSLAALRAHLAAGG